MRTAEQVLQLLQDECIGWIVDAGEIWLPYGPHGVEGGHHFDGGCAICRASDQPEALFVLVKRVLDLGGEQ
jgi:hypothetical protein